MGKPQEEMHRQYELISRDDFLREILMDFWEHNWRLHALERLERAGLGSMPDSRLAHAFKRMVRSPGFLVRKPGTLEVK